MTFITGVLICHLTWPWKLTMDIRAKMEPVSEAQDLLNVCFITFKPQMAFLIYGFSAYMVNFWRTRPRPIYPERSTYTLNWMSTEQKKISSLQIIPRRCRHWTQLVLNCRLIGKIPRAFWYHGNVSLTLGNDLVASLKIYLYIQKRYGHPDMQNLATLKQKIWIFRF